MVMGRGSAHNLFLLRMACSTAGRTGTHLASRYERAYVPGYKRKLGRGRAYCLRLCRHPSRRGGRGGSQTRIGRLESGSSRLYPRT